MCRAPTAMAANNRATGIRINPPKGTPRLSIMGTRVRAGTAAAFCRLWLHTWEAASGGSPPQSSISTGSVNIHPSAARAHGRKSRTPIVPEMTRALSDTDPRGRTRDRATPTLTTATAMR